MVFTYRVFGGTMPRESCACVRLRLSEAWDFEILLGLTSNRVQWLDVASAPCEDGWGVSSVQSSKAHGRRRSVNYNVHLARTARCGHGHGPHFL